MMNDIQVLILSDHADAMALWAHGLRQRAIPCRSVEIDAIDNPPLELDSCSLMMLDIDGDSVYAMQMCQRARVVFGGPLLVMTYERDERFHVQVYEVGIDESIVKPIGIPLLVAKVVSWLRRTFPAYDTQSDEVGAHFHYDSSQRVITMPDGRAIRLSKLEGRLVTCFLHHPGQVLRPSDIAALVWTEGYESDNRLLKNLIYRLRQKIEPEPSQPRYFQTVLGEGYRLWW